MRQEMLTARDQGRDEFAMPEQPTELEVNEFKLVQDLRCGDSFLPGQGVISGLKVLRAQSRACLPLAFGRSTQDLQDQIIFCHDVKKLCKKVAIDWRDQQKTESNKKGGHFAPLNDLLNGAENQF